MLVRCPSCCHSIDTASPDESWSATCAHCGQQIHLVSADEHNELPESHPKRVAHFELQRIVGQGRFGVVWRAWDTQLDRTVAIKLPRPEGLPGSEMDALLREARAAAQLNHPRIVKIYEVGRVGSGIYLASEFIDGQTLQDRLEAGRFSNRDAASMVAEIAEAVHSAHQAGVIHRDLKPGNILVDREGCPHVADFGLARRLSSELTMTQTGRILGTFYYMAPEQAAGHANTADARADVYSLGVILFELLTGEVPFRGEPHTVLQHIQSAEPPSPRSLNQFVSPDLETICLKCLEKLPTRRYSSALELAEELRRHLGGIPILSRAISPMGRLNRWAGRNRLVASLSATAAILLVAVAIISTVAALRIATARDAARRSAETSAANFAAAQLNAAKQREARQQAEANLQEAALQRTRAEDNLRQARRAVDDYLTAVSTSTPLATPALEPVRKTLLEAALAYHRDFLEQSGHDPAQRAETAASLFRVGMIKQILAEDPFPDFAKALELLEALWPNLTSVEQLGSLRRGVFMAARNNVVIEDPQLAWNTTLAGRRMYEALVGKFPDEPGLRHDLAIICGSQGFMLRRNRLLSEAIAAHEAADRAFAPVFESGKATDEDAYAHANNTLQKARALWAANRVREAATAFREAIQLFQGLSPGFARGQDAVYNLACTQRDLSTVLATRLDDLPSALVEQRSAVEIFARLAVEIPQMPLFHQEVAVNAPVLAALQLAGGEQRQAVESLERSLAAWDRLSRDFPDSADPFPQELSATWNTCLGQLSAEAAERLRHDQEALEIRWRRQLVERHPTDVPAKQALARRLLLTRVPDLRDPTEALRLSAACVGAQPEVRANWQTHAWALTRNDRLAEAKAAVLKSMSMGLGGDGVDWILLAFVDSRDGQVPELRGLLDRGRTWLQEHPSEDPPTERFYRELLLEAEQALADRDGT